MSQPDCASRDTIDQIEITSPCTVSWDEMRAAGGAVLDALIAAREGRVCVRILRRPDGTVVTADCWARLRAARRRGFLPFLGIMVLVGLTEIIAIGAGLCRLRSLLAGGSPPPALLTPKLRRPEVLPWDIDESRMMGLIGTRPPVQPQLPELGGLVPRHHLMGKMKRN